MNYDRVLAYEGRFLVPRLAHGEGRDAPFLCGRS